ncbi:MAG: hypothetical protein HKO81_00445 [Flavobacteriaceae bacterium]|nr:hypothetical protein [Flavobacteriaceae bacterium]
MTDLGTIFSGIRTAISVTDKVLPKKGTRINDKVKAVSAMQRAINTTEAYLTRSKNHYIPNEQLSNLWLDAFTAMIKIDKQLALSLRQKSKFWSNPQKWIKEDGAMELIPDLNGLNEKCEMILLELQKRKKL